MSAPVRIRIWLLVFALLVLHFLLHVGLAYGSGAPDLLTVALLLAAREIGLGRAAVLGLSFGLLEDALSVLALCLKASTETSHQVWGKRRTVSRSRS